MRGLSPGRRRYPFPGKAEKVAPVRATGASVARAAALLRGGGVVAFPTETVYGLGALAFDPAAAARIFEIKGRPSFDPLIVHVLDDSMLARVVAEVSPLARRLMDRFWPGALTLVLPKDPRLPALVTAGLATVAVRRPSHPVPRDVPREPALDPEELLGLVGPDLKVPFEIREVIWCWL